MTSATRTKVFLIFGVPEKNTAFVAQPLIHGLGPAGATYDLETLKAQIDAACAAVTAEQDAEVTALVTAWDAVTPYRELKVTGDGGSTGTLLDDDKRRKNIRRALSNLLGVAVPSGGFEAEARRMDCHRIIR